MAQDNDISSIDFNVSTEERIKRLKSVNIDNLEYPYYPYKASKYMITEDYVSFKVARLLKDKGFDQNCANYYLNGEVWRHYYGEVITKDKQIYAAPTLQMAMKWLREVHNLHIWIDHAAGKCLSWYYEIHGISDGKVKHIGSTQCGSYEIACEVAIEYCLENLI